MFEQWGKGYVSVRHQVRTDGRTGEETDLALGGRLMRVSTLPPPLSQLAASPNYFPTS